jgi:hypothetical protein
MFDGFYRQVIFTINGSMHRCVYNKEGGCKYMKAEVANIVLLIIKSQAQKKRYKRFF